MNSNPYDVFNQKVSLIYEYDNKSPLFARVADIELERNNIDEAIQILTDGITHHPDFSVAYFLLGKAHTLKGNYGQALKFVKKGSELIHSSKSFDYYLREIDAIKKQRQLFNVSRWANTANENFYNQSPPVSNQTEENKSLESIAETLNKLTAEIEGASEQIKEAKKQISVTRSKDYSNNDLIISETLAKIYVTQGEFKEAINVYKKLKVKSPDKEAYFDSKISELNDRLSN
ncbi:MAG TPA: hypothetical protein PK073_01575 [Ignavibacteriaceae bacterium]|jgi:tetratricopeptide (TPR) repeat protein|nr:MAG: Tetratricopeptide repeat protein [Ignavibacteria bacterium ADurb.Bin266]OQY75015.1 MAG: hypothetical protein B6D44_03065 [Ignavibacteriales bacterium UTCHB2]HQF41571.1 hypothetical protein [Ignavibacteriaceae bacterium]HQI41789.1 hypothetical protein [Ignavibacteriaceae bacterium]HQJ45490.1 hypothetical protein [Ignavibacteriaceae bacterium]